MYRQKATCLYMFVCFVNVFVSVCMFSQFVRQCICLYALSPGVGGISCPVEEEKPVATIGGNSEPGGRSVSNQQTMTLDLYSKLEAC